MSGFKGAQGDWIECTKEKPELGIDVQVFCSDTKEQFVAFRIGKYYQYAYVNDARAVCEPTHWMPLPEAPIE